MEYVNLGQSGMRVSKFVLGTMSFAGTGGFAAVGSLVGAEARRLVDTALDAGVNAFDTANVYSHGAAETVLGEALAGRRDQALVFTKAGMDLGGSRNDGGASRIHLTAQLELSLRRLRTDYVDLFFIHRWDGTTPVEETVATLTSLVQAGKIRYWGVSNYSGWSLAKTVMAARAMGAIQPVSQQIYYTAEAREAEYELLPAGQDLGVGAMIWSPLGQGLLSGKFDRDRPAQAGTRQGSGTWHEPWVLDQERLYRVVDALRAVAGERGVPVALVALAWVKDRPGVGPVVVGARNEAQLRENLAAEGVTLTREQHDRIEEAARPAPFYPFWHRAMTASERPSPAEAGYLAQYRATLSGH